MNTSIVSPIPLLSQLQSLPHPPSVADFHLTVTDHGVRVTPATFGEGMACAAWGCTFAESEAER